MAGFRLLVISLCISFCMQQKTENAASLALGQLRIQADANKRHAMLRCEIKRINITRACEDHH